MSNTTYFADPSDKGEVDVFLINEDVISEYYIKNIFNFDENINENNSMFVIAKSFYGYGHEHSLEFLNDIKRFVIK